MKKASVGWLTLLVLVAPFSLMALFDDASIIEADKLVFGVENQVESIV